MTSTSPLSGPTSGPIVGGYRLLARIGEGGMGVVHLAEGRDGRRTALKVLRPHVVGDDEARQRLAREVASLRQVRSPHVAEVLDADPWGEVPYVVTRYVPGHSLHETVRRDGPLPPADLLHVAQRLLEAVRDVHAADVLHRDLKPTNVVMEGRSPILIDFGLARLAEDPRLTVTGWLLGTPGYLAPEMLFGDPATAATDVHGWAATLVYAATGRSPYGAGHSMAILDRTRRGEVDLAGVPDSLRPILTACLSVEPLGRPSVPELGLLIDSLRPASGPAGADAAGSSTRPNRAGGAAIPAEPPVTMPWPLAAPETAAGIASDAPTVVQPAVQPDRSSDAPTVVQPAVPGPQPPPTWARAAPTHVQPLPTRVQPPPVGGPPPSSIAPTPGAAASSSARPAMPFGQRRHAAGPEASQQPFGPSQAAPQALPQAPGSAYPLAASRPAGPGQPLTGWGRLRRGTSLLLLGAVLAVSFAVAPYLAAIGVATGAVLLRGAAFAQEATWRRRMTRGATWADGARAVVGYPWHLLRSFPGSAFLLLTAAVLGMALVGTATVLGVGDREALLAGGAVVVATVWWGPGGQRVRLPVGRATTAAVRHPLAGLAAVALLTAVLLGAWTAASSGATWAPDDGAPWRSVEELLPAELRSQL